MNTDFLIKNRIKAMFPDLLPYTKQNLIRKIKIKHNTFSVKLENSSNPPHTKIYKKLMDMVNI